MAAGFTEGADASFASYGRRWAALLQRPWGFTLDRRIVRWTGFSPMAWINCRIGRRPYTPVLLLTTVGAKSGELRDRVLPYVVVDGTPVVIGSNFGGARNPDWVTNLLWFERCWVRVGRKSSSAAGRVAGGADRDRLFREVAEMKPNVVRYQHRADTYGRQIPLVRLDVRDPEVLQKACER